MAVAHDFSGKARTNDVLISESIDFAGLLLSKPVLNGLKNAGFERPSPIQLKAIPLGRCGLDLIVQAKSGTGKTCVFSVVALEGLKPTASSTQVLVLAPTREIALQIWEVICSIGSAIPELCCHTFIGGMPVHEDKKKLQKCHIAVGTPGRIQSLIQQKLLKTKSIRLFVLDEADKLLEEGFQKQINWIYSALPDNKQMLALSATYPEYLAEHLTLYMRNPTFVRLNITDPTLLGIKQYYTMVPSHPLPNRVFEAKTAAVIRLLSSVAFNQCLIFSNLQTRAQNLQNELSYQGWPTSCIAGCLNQKDRITAITKLKTYSCRILISTDLTSRGIDADRVNLVINLDVPHDHETYLHRIGRAGRFGSYGAGVSIVSDGQELADMHKIEHYIGTHVLPLPDPIPQNLVKLQLPVNLEDVVSTEQIITRSEDCAVSSTDLRHTSTPQNVSPTDITGQSTTPSGSNGHVDQCTDTASCAEEGDLAVPSEDQAVRENRQTDRPELSTNGGSGGVEESKNRGWENPGMARIETDADVHVCLESERIQTTEKRGSDCSSESLSETTSAKQKIDASLSSDVRDAEASGLTSDFRCVNGGHHVSPKDSKEHCSSTNERKNQENKSDILGERNLQQRAGASHEQLAHTSDSEAASIDVTSMANSADTGDNAVCNRKTSQRSESAVKPETEPSRVKKNHKGRATGDLWASMLIEQDREEMPGPQQDTPPPSASNKKQACTRQNSSEKRGKKAVSWDKELELYLAFRSKVGSVSENSGEEGQELGTGVSAVANRPMKRATRLCPAARQKKPVPSGADNCLNGQADVGASKTECKDHSALTLSSTMAQKEEGREKGREAAFLNGDGSDHHLTMESEKQSSQKSFGKPYLSKDPKVQAAFLASAEQHGFKEVLLQHKNHEPLPEISICKKQAKRSAVPQTYMSLLQNYKQYLEKTDTPPMKTISSIVQQTFSLPPAPGENQRQQLLQFLGHFYTQWDRTHLTDLESVDKDANGDDKERQREVRSKLTVETVSMKTNDRNTFRFDQKLQTLRTEKKKGKESGGNGLDMAVNSRDSTISAASTEPKSSTVNASRDHRGKEDHAAVKRKEETVEKKKRTPRYRPMAVFGPATLHLFQSKDNTGEGAGTSEVTEVLSSDRSNDTTNATSFSEFQNGVCVSQKTLPGLQSSEMSHDSIGPEKAENSLIVNGFVSTSQAAPTKERSRLEDHTGPCPGRQNTGDLNLTVRQKAVSKPAGISSLGKGAIPKQRHAELPRCTPVLNGAGPKQPHSKPAGKSAAKGAIAKQLFLGSRKKVQSSDEDSSSDDSSSSSSTSTANEEAFPRTEGLEEKLMCFQNQYAVETSVHGRAKKLGPKARTGRKGKEERLKLQTELSSSQEDRLEKRQHRRRTRSGMGRVNTAEAGEYSWYPYSLENNSSDYYAMQNTADQSGVHPQHSYAPSFCTDQYPPAWSSPYPGMSSYTAHKMKKGQRTRDEGLPYTEYGQQGHTGSHSDWYSHAEQNQSYPYPASWQTTGYSFPPSSQGPVHPYPVSHQSSAYSSSISQNPEYPTWQQHVGYTYPASQQNRGTPYPASQQSQGSPYHTWQQSQGYPHPFSQQNPRSYPPSQNQGSFQASQPMHGSLYHASLHNHESPYSQSQWTYSDTYQQNRSGYYQPAEYQPWQRADLQGGHPSVPPSVEDLAQAQAAKAQSLNNYIRSMSKFYARFCARRNAS